MWSHNFWHTTEHGPMFKTIWASDFKFGKRLWLTIAIWLSGPAYYITTVLLWGSMVGYPSDSLASCQYRTMILPARCYASADLCARDVSVRPSVTRRYCIVVISSPPGSSTILVFWCQISSRHSKGSPPGWRPQTMVGWENSAISIFKHQYLENGTVADRAKVD